MNRQKSIAYDTFCIDSYNRVSSNQAVQLLVHLHLYTKSASRRLRDVDLGYLARVHAGNLHLRTLGDAVKIHKLGIQDYVSRERLVTTPNKEDAESEERCADDNENSDSKVLSRHQFAP
jgi:hypothetical protein